MVNKNLDYNTMALEPNQNFKFSNNLLTVIPPTPSARMKINNSIEAKRNSNVFSRVLKRLTHENNSLEPTQEYIDKLEKELMIQRKELQELQRLVVDYILRSEEKVNNL